MGVLIYSEVRPTCLGVTKLSVIKDAVAYVLFGDTAHIGQWLVRGDVVSLGPEEFMHAIGIRHREEARHQHGSGHGAFHDRFR